MLLIVKKIICVILFLFLPSSVTNRWTRVLQPFAPCRFGGQASLRWCPAATEQNDWQWEPEGKRPRGLLARTEPGRRHQRVRSWCDGTQTNPANRKIPWLKATSKSSVVCVCVFLYSKFLKNEGQVELCLMFCTWPAAGYRHRPLFFSSSLKFNPESWSEKAMSIFLFSFYHCVTWFQAWGLLDLGHAAS